MKNTKAQDVRVSAALVLKAVFNGQSLSAALADADVSLNNKDAALLQELCFGVCRFYHRYQCLTRDSLHKPLKRKDQDVLALIYLGAHQLLHLRTPDHAAISTVVNAAKALKKPWAAGLVNAVLRKLQKSQVDWTANPATEYSHPGWFIDMLSTAWPTQWTDILNANNAQAPMTLRIHRQKTTPEQYQALLSEHHINATVTAHSPEGLQLSKACDVSALPNFANGVVSVQDEAAQMAAHLLDLEPGQRVLDACSAPGGKACHALELEPKLRELVAVDVDATRMARVEENLTRLGLQATLKVADLQNLDAWWDGALFDRILLDAPCSATGVIRRHPDIKLLRQQQDIEKLVVLQQSLLSTLWQTLKPGGKLVYATCSVLPQENENQIKAFITQQSHAKALAIEHNMGTPLEFGRQLFPDKHSHDGFYYAILTKAV